jgi:hypothetical protein
VQVTLPNGVRHRLKKDTYFLTDNTCERKLWCKGTTCGSTPLNQRTHTFQEDMAAARELAKQEWERLKQELIEVEKGLSLVRAEVKDKERAVRDVTKKINECKWVMYSVKDDIAICSGEA